jgi:C_GCAxxG_C_C family probable redox protein
MKDKEERISRAVAYFMQGYNCSQSVVAAFADLYGFTEKQAFHMAASFGGGIGRMRLTCGAVCGMFMLVGLDDCAVEGSDRIGKSRNYAVVQSLAEKFRSLHGSITCSELLKLRAGTPVSSQAEQRTAEYYAKRPCARMVESAARIFSEYIESTGR